MEDGVRRHDDMLPHENKTSTTLPQSPPAVTAVASPRAGLCRYRIAAGAAHGCNRPALAGSAFCAWHRVAPEFFDESDDERLAGLDLPAPGIAHDE